MAVPLAPQADHPTSPTAPLLEQMAWLCWGPVWMPCASATPSCCRLCCRAWGAFSCLSCECIAVACGVLRCCMRRGASMQQAACDLKARAESTIYGSAPPCCTPLSPMHACCMQTPCNPPTFQPQPSSSPQQHRARHGGALAAALQGDDVTDCAALLPARQPGRGCARDRGAGAVLEGRVGQGGESVR